MLRVTVVTANQNAYTGSVVSRIVNMQGVLGRPKILGGHAHLFLPLTSAERTALDEIAVFRFSVVFGELLLKQVSIK